MALGRSNWAFGCSTYKVWKTPESRPWRLSALPLLIVPPSLRPWLIRGLTLAQSPPHVLSVLPQVKPLMPGAS